MNFSKPVFLFLAMIGFIACKKEVIEDPFPDTSVHIFNPELMTAANLLESVQLKEVVMSDGTVGTCYELVFKSNPIADGPYCPRTIDEIGGVGIYDGNTQPGFQVMQASLWEAMEADGYDIVDEDGNIRVTDPGAGTGPPAGSSCLEATPDNSIRITFRIPAVPQLGSSNDVINIVENVGVSKDGIPLTGHPPSATSGPPGVPAGMFTNASIPAIDPCGGHIDPFGYYHLHFGPEEINSVFDANGITEVSCTNFEQSETAFIGYAKDGFPIYASKDFDNSIASDLDECQGHTSTTNEYPDGVYHYHVSNSRAPNLPECLKGISAQNSISYQ
jgi:hypothetical protein